MKGEPFGDPAGGANVLLATRTRGPSARSVPGQARKGAPIRQLARKEGQAAIPCAIRPVN